MFNEDRNQFPFWLGGVLLALLLIVIGMRLSGGGTNPVLMQRFAAHPDPSAPTAQPFQLPLVRLPELPPEVQRNITSLRQRLAGGEAVPALTPVATSARLRIEVSAVQREGDQMHVKGSVHNTSAAAVTIPASAFSFRDSAGILYAITASGSATLQPGESTPIDLAVPLPPSRGLSLVLSLPPDPPIEQILIVEPRSS